ncbi:MAG: TerB family tellurite resistance protein [Flavisolibacter sp.]|nr:TerB family tellurite resistance protein [Flavisolibacter sp.]
METQERLLKDHTDMEKGAYLCAIASIATADRQASEEEIEFLGQLADEAELSPEQKQAVIQAATDIKGEDLKQCLDVLKGSDLRFSLIADLIAFANADQNYSPEERANVEKIAQYLNINQQQFSFLDQFVKKTAESNASPEELKKPGFLQQLGLEDKMKSAGINSNQMMKTILGVAGPILLATMLRRRRGGILGGSSFGSGGFGGGLGGGLFGGGLGGSLIGMLGGRGMRSTGGLLGRVLGGRGMF